MKTCTSCCEDLPLSAFSPQKTNKSKLYAWCDGCRKKNVPYVKPLRKDYMSMREKAMQLRKFNDEQAAVLKQRYQAGETVPALASEYGVSKATVYKTLHRPLTAS